ncbi:hypothetical protein QUV83_03420 [Cellulomonas cellasea]|uniref:hypothetical protein n=1 Tax=Cellulomonas cellasea TaxID=43670 RepID=UPI0025A3F41C|nr:hypothetical protein [Cellulomonas cellasea]MDM8083814.1 hypothetical protein [Cellulomonas cellasea]
MPASTEQHRPKGPPERRGRGLGEARLQQQSMNVSRHGLAWPRGWIMSAIASANPSASSNGCTRVVTLTRRLMAVGTADQESALRWGFAYA